MSEETVNMRIRKIRLALNLKQDEFSEKIGMSKTGLCRMENSTSNVTDKVKKLIYMTYNVNPEYLDTGTGDMFLSPQQQRLHQLADENQFTDTERAFFDSYLSLAPDNREVIIEFLQLFVEKYIALRIH